MVENTVKHELGHIFGLNHFTAAGQPMVRLSTCSDALTVKPFDAAQKHAVNQNRTSSPSSMNALVNPANGKQLHCSGPDPSSLPLP